MNILITGANRGLGLRLTKTGLRNNRTIFAGVRNTLPNKIQELMELKETYKEKLSIIELDVTSEQSVMDARDKVKQVSASIDVIINNAAILNERDKDIEEIDIEAFSLALDINTLGPVRVVKHFLPMLEKGNKQSIINISSESGSLTNSYSGDYPYGISKVAVNMLSEKLNVYLKDKDVQVLSIHPGWMKTDMGGERAPLDPMESAKSIFELIERKRKAKGEYVFVDYQGNPMKI